MLADRAATVAALTKIFLDEFERALITASGVTAAADTPSASRPRLGGISFLHRFGSKPSMCREFVAEVPLTGLSFDA